MSGPHIMPNQLDDDELSTLEETIEHKKKIDATRPSSRAPKSDDEHPSLEESRAELKKARDATYGSSSAPIDDEHPSLEEITKTRKEAEESMPKVGALPKPEDVNTSLVARKSLVFLNDATNTTSFTNPDYLKQFRAAKDFGSSSAPEAESVKIRYEDFMYRLKDNTNDNHWYKMLLRKIDEYIDPSSAPVLTEEHFYKNWGLVKPEIVVNINRFYGKIIIKGKYYVLHVKTNGEVEFLSRRDFIYNFEDMKIQEGEKWVDIGTIWLKSPDSLKYDEFIFDPSKPCGRYAKSSNLWVFNLWRGFGTQSIKGHCYKFLHHLRWVCCKGDKKLYRYLLALLAQIVQQPHIKPGIAISLVGKRGAGKSFIAETMGRLVSGPKNLHGYYVQTADQNHIFGNHNEHMGKAIILQDEEATWAGDIRAEKKLNNFITAPTLLVNPKNLPAIMMDNFTRIFIIANPGWSVPASWDDERRYIILYVSDAHAKEIPYFSAIHKELDNGGYEALMYFLMNYDISKIDLRSAPITEGTVDQKIRSMYGLDAWMFDIIKSGEIPIFGDIKEDGGCHVVRAKFRHDFSIFQNAMPGRSRSTDTKFGMDLHTFFRTLSEKLNKRDLRGELIPLLRISTSSVTENGKTVQVPTYVIASLPCLREAMNLTLGQDFDWGDDWKQENWKVFVNRSGF